MNVKTSKKGFTLTEILIVLVIAGILLALILPNSLKAVARGNTVSGDSNVQSCSTAVLMCYADNNQNWTAPNDCTDTGVLVAKKYLKAVGNNAAGAAVTVVVDAAGGYKCQ